MDAQDLDGEVLTRLQRLRHLSIVHKGTDNPDEQEDNAEFGEDGLLVLPAFADFPALESFGFSFRADLWYEWEFLVGNARIVYCRYASACPGEGRLEIGGIREMESLQQQLLCALVPAGKPLTRLDLAGMDPSVLSDDAACLQGCSLLQHLTSLGAYDCPLGGAALGVLLPQAPRLLELDTATCLQGELPASLINRQGLHTLVLEDAQLQDMPPGPYLSSLTSLDLSWNRYSALPPALAGATSLRTLQLVSRRPGLALTRGAVDSILMRMPHLRVLAMNTDRTPARVLRALRRGLPGLEITQDSTFSEIETDSELEAD